MKGKTVLAPAVTPINHAEEFIKEYNLLCEKHQCRISVTPIWKLRDDGTFSLVLQYGLEKLPEPS